MHALKVLPDGKYTREEVNLHWQACVSNCVVNIEDVYQNIWFGTPSLLVVMEYMAGGDLSKRIHKHEASRLTELQAAAVTKQIVAALAHLHEMNVVHCDVKPENLLFESDSLDSPLKLTDFGLARLKTSDSEDVLEIQESSSFYMYHPPEVLRGEKYDTSCDMWALGCTIYTLLSGNFPFNIFNVSSVIPGMRQNVSHGECTFPDLRWKHISHEAKDLIRQLLKTDPKERMSLEDMRAHPWITGNEMKHPSNPITTPHAS